MKHTAQILLVDDDVMLLQALPQALYLRIDEVEVDTCDSAPEALNQIQEHEYDAIVSDIKMPGMDGLTLLAKINAPVATSGKRPPMRLGTACPIARARRGDFR